MSCISLQKSQPEDHGWSTLLVFCVCGFPSSKRSTKIGPLSVLAFLVVTTFATFYSAMMYHTGYYAVSFIAFSLLACQISFSLLTVLANPGIPNRDFAGYNIDTLKSAMSALSYCRICKVIKDPAKQIHHCASCDICVEGYDHHCPWIGKCVGKGNLRYFYAYIGSTMSLLIFLAVSATVVKQNIITN